MNLNEPKMSTLSTDLAVRHLTFSEASFSQAGISDDDLKCGPKLEKCTVSTASRKKAQEILTSKCTA